MSRQFQFFSVQITKPNYKTTILEITLNDELNQAKTTIEFWAAAPPTLGVSFSGSALPYYDAEQAFNNSPNIGKFTPHFKKSIIKLHTPNSYYSHLGTRLIESCVSVKITYDNVSVVELVNLGTTAPYRSLTYPSTRNSPMFYDRSHLQTPRSQESILRASGYPSCKSSKKTCASSNKCADFMNHSTENSFWGLAVPHP